MSLVPDYRINLIEPYRMEPEDFRKLHTSLAEALQYIKCSNQDEELERLVNDNANFKMLDRRTAELINEVTGSRLKLNKNKEVVNVCKAIEDMKKKAVAAAEAENSRIREELGRKDEELDKAREEIAQLRRQLEKLMA